MNFKKIELIFFIAFILLDIFLFASYSQKDDVVESTVSTTTKHSSNSILKSIKSDQISVGELSTKKTNGYYIAAFNKDAWRSDAGKLHDVLWTFNSHRLTATFENRIKLKNSEKPQQTLDEVVKDSTKVINGDKYVYDKYLSTRKTVVYVQQVKNKPIYSPTGQIRFNLKKNYVLGYTQKYIPEIQSLKGKRPVISQERALIWLYQYNKLVNNSTVKWIRLSYTRLLNANNSTIYIPTWVLAVESNSSGSVQYRRINAFTGAYMEENVSLR
ncbi:two-component system regulatory protein YycI [Liquorilactobacillus vini]|uniref:YycH family protein n=1 Tax=Liquorilactobacillus vini DSM 20605 TaxID=1133569 RepID=A0A0R2C423_9LACO|nr:two-component system regulatory protein YycI [Liquorilactobacillus vini]KRM86318.1 YycH family protein [Liquorilactobacillus vini DSM 20605]